jgi:hypothetical protein
MFMNQPTNHPSPVDRMVIFFVALLLLCFKISNTSTRAFVTVMSVVTVLLIMWCIQLAWETTDDFDLWLNSKLALRRARDGVAKRIKEFGEDLLSPFPTRRAPDVAHSGHSGHSILSMAERRSNLGGV